MLVVAFIVPLMVDAVIAVIIGDDKGEITMTNKVSWDAFKEKNIVGSDKDLLDMMQDCINASKLLNSINESKYQLAIIELSHDWYALSLVAQSRDIDEYPKF